MWVTFGESWLDGDEPIPWPAHAALWDKLAEYPSSVRYNLGLGGVPRLSVPREQRRDRLMRTGTGPGRRAVIAAGLAAAGGRAAARRSRPPRPPDRAPPDAAGIPAGYEQVDPRTADRVPLTMSLRDGVPLYPGDPQFTGGSPPTPAPRSTTTAATCSSTSPASARTRPATSPRRCTSSSAAAGSASSTRTSPSCRSP